MTDTLDGMEVWSVAPETRAAILEAVQIGMAGMRADPPQRLADWAAEHFTLEGEASHQKGAWEAWPPQIGILDAMSNDDIEEMDVQKSKRVGYTKMLTAFIAYNIAHRRRKQAVWQPTDDDRDSFVKSEVDPVLDTLKAIQPLMRKSVEETIKYKPFRGSVLHLLGGKAARAYRRITVSVSILDEWDGFDQQVEKSSDPGTLAKGRLEGAAYPKFIGGSTPRLKGLSHTEAARLNADADMRYEIPCPHCDAEHPLLWGGKKVQHGFKWTRGEPSTVRHVCPHCRQAIDQGDYLRVWGQGTWVCERTGLRYGQDRTWRTASGEPTRAPRHVAFRIWAAYSPQREWVDIVREFEAALKRMDVGDNGPMQGFVNETLGETWELHGDRSDEHVLQARAEPYPLGTVPVGCLILTAGVDVQGDRWELYVWGWGRGMESWLVDRVIIEGNPERDEDWDQLDVHLARRYRQAWHGGTLGIESLSIDSGHHTQAVYAWVRRAQARGTIRVHAIKGSSQDHKPIRGTASSVDVSWKGQKWPGGVKLWEIGSDTAKDLLHGQLAIEQPGPGYLHFSADLPREFYEQLTAEQRIPVRTPRGDMERWVKRRPRNEALDCRNYALHAAYALGLDQWKPARWDAREAMVQPPADLFSVAAQADAPNAPASDDTPAAPLPVVVAAAQRTNSSAQRARARGRDW